MPHRRQSIRDAVVALVTGLPSGATVTTGRVHPAAVAALPTIDVSTPEETSESLVDGTSHRQLTVAVNIRSDGATYYDELDAIALDVESAVSADRDLGGLVDDIKVESTSTEESGDMETPVGLMALLFTCAYSVDVTDPQ